MNNRLLVIVSSFLQDTTEDRTRFPETRKTELLIVNALCCWKKGTEKGFFITCKSELVVLLFPKKDSTTDILGF